MKNQLPVILQQEIKSYTQYALPLCVVYQEQNYYPWILKEFIQIMSIRKHNNEGNILSYTLRKKIKDHLMLYNMYKEIMDMESLPVDSISNINDKVLYFKEKINTGYYIHPFMDEFYIKEKSNYNISHFIHPSLLYGYDDNEKIFEAIGFFKNEKFSYYKIGYDEIETAINSMAAQPNLKKYYGIFFYKLKPIDGPYKFTINEFKTILHDYLYPQHDEEFKYGYDMYKLILENLENPFAPSFFLKYNTIHLLYEHKNTFYNTLKHFFENTDKNELCMKYLKVKNMFNNLRLLYIKYNFDKKSFRILTDKSISQKIYIMLKNATEEEKKVLLYIYENIK